MIPEQEKGDLTSNKITSGTDVNTSEVDRFSHTNWPAVASTILAKVWHHKKNRDLIDRPWICFTEADLNLFL